MKNVFIVIIAFFIGIVELNGCENKKQPSEKQEQEKQPETLLEFLSSQEYEDSENKRGRQTFIVNGDRVKITWQSAGHSKVNTSFENYYYDGDTLTTDKNFYKFFLKGKKIVCQYQCAEESSEDTESISLDELEPIFAEDMITCEIELIPVKNNPQPKKN